MNVDTTDSAPQLIVTSKSTQPHRWRLHVLSSPDRTWRGRILDLPAQGTSIGRVAPEGTSSQIADSTLSRQHLELEPLPDNSGVRLRDLGSHNGTLRGGVRVTTAVIGDGAVLRFGDSVAVLECDAGQSLAFSTPTADVPGRSVVARRLRAALDSAARDRTPVLLVGPTGAGKEFAAQEIHRRAGREGPLVRIHGASIASTEAAATVFGTLQTPGLLQTAAGGAVLLDGLDDLDAEWQPVLLRALEERRVPTHAPSGSHVHDVLWIATASDALEEKVQDGRVRRDLAARFLSHRIRVAPLAERAADLFELADALLVTPTGDPWTSFLLPDAVEAMLLRAWPDNLRELLAVLRHLRRQYVGAALGADALPEQPSRPKDALELTLAQQSSRNSPDGEALHKLLKRYHGNVEKVAAHFGRHRKQIYRWLERAGIGDRALTEYRRGEGA